MAWRLAKSIDVLRSQINNLYPDRRKSSDGTIGDEAHASRSSDHNPWVKDGKIGVVTAIDFTNDPEHGIDAGDLAELLLASRDHRIKYIISNRRIANSSKTGGAAAWAWRSYSGANPHTKHMHLSVKSAKKSYDDTRPWKLEVKPKADMKVPLPTPAPPVDPAVRGDPDIWHTQRRLKAMNYNPGGLDGIWGGNTAGAIGGFLNDRDTKIAAPTSPDMFLAVKINLLAEITKAEAERFVRPISVERAEITPAELAEKKPAVKSAQAASFWSKVQGWWSAAFGGVTAGGLVTNVMTAKETVDPLRSWVADAAPFAAGLAAVVAVIAIAVVLARKSSGAANDSVDASVADFRTGAQA